MRTPVLKVQRSVIQWLDPCSRLPRPHVPFGLAFISTSWSKLPKLESAV